jgi:serine/threonine-protein kinase HipA
MKFEPVKIVYVYYKPEDTKIFMGRLALKDRKLFFEYESSFINTGLNLSPFKLPLKSNVIASNDSTFDGLFGVFNDSLPDGWGRLLLDRALIKHNLNPGSLSILDRLCLVGSNGMGALIYEPETESSPIILKKSLEEIAEEIVEFQEHNDDNYVEDLLKLGGSSAGARPKILMNIDNEHWLIKFPSNTDPKDIGSIEYAYHLMAKNAGLDVPDAKLFPSKKGFGFFGCKRFDKIDKHRIHMHTISGLLHADHRTPSLDYEIIMKATMHLTRNMQECVKQYRQCVFNVLSHNRDDHSKNFSFLMDPNGIWQVSPSYDLTFSSGPSGEHCSMIMTEGKNPGILHLLELAKIINIKKHDALDIIDEVKSSIKKWPEFAKQANVNNTNIKLINSVIIKIIKENF